MISACSCCIKILGPKRKKKRSKKRHKPAELLAQTKKMVFSRGMVMIVKKDVGFGSL